MTEITDVGQKKNAKPYFFKNTYEVIEHIKSNYWRSSKKFFINNDSFNAINIEIDKSISRREFKLLSSLIQVVDIPGIEDNDKQEEI